MYVDPINVFVSTQGNQNVMDTDTCTGDPVKITAGFGGWRTDNSSVATASNAVVTGVGAGQTTHYANGIENITVGKQCTRSNRGSNGPVGVQVPTSLKVLSVTVLPNGSGPPNGCPGSQNYGIKVDIKYQVLDQDSNSIQASSMTPHEKGVLFDGTAFDTDIGPFPGYPTSSQNTATDGTFHDVPFRGVRKRPYQRSGPDRNSEHHHDNARRIKTCGTQPKLHGDGCWYDELRAQKDYQQHYQSRHRLGHFRYKVKHEADICDVCLRTSSGYRHLPDWKRS